MGFGAVGIEKRGGEEKEFFSMSGGRYTSLKAKDRKQEIDKAQHIPSYLYPPKREQE